MSQQSIVDFPGEGVSMTKVAMIHGKSVLLPLAFLFLAGCSLLDPEIPKCSDPATEDLVRQIIGESGGKAAFTDDFLREHLNFNLPNATGLQENIKNYTCEADLLITNNGASRKFSVTYTSQLDDSNQHLVSVGSDLSDMVLQLLVVIRDGGNSAEDQEPSVDEASGSPITLEEQQANNAADAAQASADAAAAAANAAAQASEQALNGPAGSEPTAAEADSAAVVQDAASAPDATNAADDSPSLDSRSNPAE
jgi:hypothetical protein